MDENFEQSNAFRDVPPPPEDQNFSLGTAKRERHAGSSLFLRQASCSGISALRIQAAG